MVVGAEAAPRRGRIKHITVVDVPGGLRHGREGGRGAAAAVARVLAGEPPTPHGVPAPDRVQRAAALRRLRGRRLPTEETQAGARDAQDPGTTRLAISATCVRVPVWRAPLRGGVDRDRAEPLAPDEVRELLSPARRAARRRRPSLASYPMPIEAAGTRRRAGRPHPPRRVAQERHRRCGWWPTTCARAPRSNGVQIAETAGRARSDPCPRAGGRRVTGRGELCPVCIRATGGGAASSTAPGSPTRSRPPATGAGWRARSGSPTSRGARLPPLPGRRHRDPVGMGVRRPRPHP